jgi:hypothetical protein
MKKKLYFYLSFFCERFDLLNALNENQRKSLISILSVFDFPIVPSWLNARSLILVPIFCIIFSEIERRYPNCASSLHAEPFPFS